MTNKVDLRKELSRLAGPIFIETVLVSAMGSIDTFMLSRHSDEAVAAVGVVNQLMIFAFLFFQIVNIGTSVLCSQYLGAKMREKMVQVTGVALLLNLVLGVSISALLYLCAEPMLRVMGLTGKLLELGVPYMEIVGFFAFFQALHMTVSASLRSDNKAIYPMLVVVVVNIVNIIGNYALIFGNLGMPELGVVGAAIATSFSRGVAMVLLFIALFTKHISKFPLKLFMPFPWIELKNLLKIGVPSAGENMSYQTQQIVLTYFITQMGTVALTTRTYVINIVVFVYIFVVCMGNSGAISIGHLVGKHKPHAAYLMGNYVLRMSLQVVLTLSVICALLGDRIMPMLTSNPDVVALGCTILFYDIIVEFGKTVNIYSVSVLRATGDVKFPFYLGVIFEWGVGIVFGYLFGLYFGWGLVGMWLAFALDENIRGIIFIWRWRSKRWAEKAFV